MKLDRKYYPALAALAFVLFLWLTFFAVRETEFVLVTQFGHLGLRAVQTVAPSSITA